MLTCAWDDIVIEKFNMVTFFLYLFQQLEQKKQRVRIIILSYYYTVMVVHAQSIPLLVPHLVCVSGPDG